MFRTEEVIKKIFQSRAKSVGRGVLENMLQVLSVREKTSQEVGSCWIAETSGHLRVRGVLAVFSTCGLWRKTYISNGVSAKILALC